MRCISCEKLSLNIICNRCQQEYLNPGFYKREITKDFYLFSFFEYDSIKELLNSKYYDFGDKIYKILAILSFKKFSENLSYDTHLYSVGIDTNKYTNFSHTAILSKELNSKQITPIYDKLQATNHIKYAGKSLEFRQNNPRNFKVRDLQNKDLIIVDDIVTTGTTIVEAKKTLESHSNKVHFTMALSDVSLRGLSID